MRDITKPTEQLNRVNKSYEELMIALRAVLTANASASNATEERDILQRKYIEFEEACDQLAFMFDQTKNALFYLVAKKTKSIKPKTINEEEKEEEELLQLKQEQEEAVQEMINIWHQSRELIDLGALKERLNGALSQIDSKKEEANHNHTSA